MILDLNKELDGVSQRGDCLTFQYVTDCPYKAIEVVVVRRDQVDRYPDTEGRKDYKDCFRSDNPEHVTMFENENNSWIFKLDTAPIINMIQYQDYVFIFTGILDNDCREFLVRGYVSFREGAS